MVPALNNDQHTAIDVVIADDHPVVLAGLRTMIEKADDIVIVGEAADGSAALKAIEHFMPAVAVLDIEMPHMGGIEVMREIQTRNIPTVPIVLTLYDERDVFEHAITLGAKGYILKDSAPQDIVRGIYRVVGGDYFLSPKVGTNNIPRNYHKEIETLTRTEHRVLKLIGEDKSSREIAAELCISPRTVDHHRANICGKLNISGQFALVRFAFQNKVHL